MAKFLVLVSVVCFTRLAYGQLLTVNPPENQFVAFNSVENITYTCTVPASRSVVWEFRGSQIRNENQFQVLANLSVFIEPANTMSQSSTITISQSAREMYNDITIQCFSDEIGGISSVGGEVYNVITVFPPAPPGNLSLIPADPTLTLEWDPPISNSSVPASLTYIVDINSTDSNVDVNFRNVTSQTSLSVHFLEVSLSLPPGQCVMFTFSVSAENIAGIGEPAAIIDTVPISPNVSNISSDLTAVVDNLQPLTVMVSFPPVTSCSVNFPLRNYTVSIVEPGIQMTITPPSQPGLVSVTFPSSSLTGIGQDSSFSVVVTAANDVTSRTSRPTRLYTTDVQRVEAILFENRLFLRCSFASNSQARGCAVIFTLTGSTETERFDLSVASDGTASLCAEANNQREAYNREEALDVEADGSDGMVRLNITSMVTVLTTEEEYVDMTGCRQPTDNTAAIVGGVIGGIFGLLLIVGIIVIIVLGIMYGWWCTWLQQEDMDGIERGLGEAAHLVLALAGVPSTDERDSGGQTPAPRETPLDQKLKKKRYLLVKTKRLLALRDNRNDRHEEQPLMDNEEVATTET